MAFNHFNIFGDPETFAHTRKELNIKLDDITPLANITSQEMANDEAFARGLVYVYLKIPDQYQTDEMLGRSLAINAGMIRSIPAEIVTRAFRSATAQGLLKPKFGNCLNVPLLLRKSTHNGLLYAEAMTGLLRLGPEKVAPFIKSDAHADLFQSLFGTDAAMTHVRTLDRAKRWMGVDMGF